MQAPAPPANENARLQSLRDLLILETPPEERFDGLTAYASAMFNVPIALVSLVDEDRQWFKSRVGLEVAETGRDISFCGHAILKDEVMVVEDAHGDPRFADNPLVTADPSIRFYAGAPIVLSDGTKPGTVCIIDRRPRVLDVDDLAHLRELAMVTARELEGHAASAAFLARHPLQPDGAEAR